MKRSRSSFSSCAGCMHCPLSPHWPSIVHWLLLIGPDQKWSKEFIFKRGPELQWYNTLAVAQLARAHGGSLLMVSVNFCVGLRLTFLLFSAAEESLSSKIEFPKKKRGLWLVMSRVAAGLASPGNPWQRKLTILLYTSRCHDMRLGSVIIPQTQLALKILEHK